MGGSTRRFKIGHYLNSGGYSSSMSNELNELYNTTIITRQNSQNAILNTKRNHVRLKGYSGASIYLTREEDQHCLGKM